MKFFDEQSGATLHMDRYYGFGDAGGIAGSFDGYPDQATAILALYGEYDMDEIGTDPEDLGEWAICVLSGQEYVDRIRQVDDIALYGHFVE